MPKEPAEAALLIEWTQWLLSLRIRAAAEPDNSSGENAVGLRQMAGERSMQVSSQGTLQTKRRCKASQADAEGDARERLNSGSRGFPNFLDCDVTLRGLEDPGYVAGEAAVHGTRSK